MKTVDTWVELWKRRLGFWDWTITIRYVDEFHPEDHTCQAEIEEDLKYKYADLTIYKSFFNDTVKVQEQTVVHELCHLFFARLHPYLPDITEAIVEEIVQTLAIQFWTLYNP